MSLVNNGTTLAARRLAWIVISLSVVLIPWVFTPGKESFRLPKEALLIAEAILLATLGAVICVTRGLPSSREWRRPEIAAAVAAVVWTGIATLTSTSVLLSLDALRFVAACAVVFIATTLLGVARDLRVLFLVYVAALPNALLVLLQEFDLWNPLYSKEVLARETIASSHAYSTGLLGNPDDVGSWFVFPIMLAAALFRTDPRRRALHAGILALCITVLLTGRSITALIAVACGLCVMAALTSLRQALAVLLTAFALLALTGLAYQPFRERILAARQVAMAGDYDALLTNRGTPFLASALMFREHPLTGVGPGCFGYSYYPYKVRIEADHPTLLRSSGRRWNFGEVHNDHLQTLAVAGLPGYLILLGFAALAARLSFGPRSETAGERSRFARTIALPLTIAVLVLMLSQFPLHLAATMSTGMFLLSLAFAWRTEE